MTATDTIQIPHGDKLSPEGEWGYAHVDAEDLWDTINLLRYYLHTIEPHGGDSDDHPTPKYRLMSATMRIASRLATDAADHLDDHDGRLKATGNPVRTGGARGDTYRPPWPLRRVGRATIRTSGKGRNIDGAHYRVG